MAELGIGDLTNGVSVDGAHSYLNDINVDAIDKAIDVLLNVDSVNTALKAGWQGSAEIKFESNLQKATTAVAKELRDIKKYNESLVADLIDDMAKHDESILEEVSEFNV